jgi:hypothetical protein
MSDARPRGMMPTDRLVDSRRFLGAFFAASLQNVTVTESYSLGVAERAYGA